jgi:hypothetical protein
MVLPGPGSKRNLELDDEQPDAEQLRASLEAMKKRASRG